MDQVKVGICGLGTVGSGTLRVMSRNAADINARAGRQIIVSHIGARRDRPGCDTGDIRVSRDIFEVVRDPEVQILVELVGGTDVARELVLQAIESGKHVVTANKALIAEHGNELFEAALNQGVALAYEAAVAGGIPIIRALREGLAGNRISWIAGIINGTSNYILTEMAQGREYAEVLKEAQALGYAEADPTFDVEGIDAAHKLVILGSIACRIPLQFDKVYTEGISHLSPRDLRYAAELGYRIKHLGIARRNNGGVELRVHPTLIPEERLIANVDGVMNAVLVEGDAVGPTLYYGAGAGGEPTASSVIADIIEIARQVDLEPSARTPYLGFEYGEATDLPVLPIEDCITSFYLRMTVQDRPGVLSAIARIFGESGISIEALIQKEAKAGQQEVPIVLITNEAREGDLIKAFDQIQALDQVIGPVVKIRVENLDG